MKRVSKTAKKESTLENKKYEKTAEREKQNTDRPDTDRHKHRQTPVSPTYFHHSFLWLSPVHALFTIFRILTLALFLQALSRFRSVAGAHIQAFTVVAVPVEHPNLPICWTPRTHRHRQTQTDTDRHRLEARMSRWCQDEFKRAKQRNSCLPGPCAATRAQSLGC